MDLSILPHPNWFSKPDPEFISRVKDRQQLVPDLPCPSSATNTV